MRLLLARYKITLSETKKLPSSSPSRTYVLPSPAIVGAQNFWLCRKCICASFVKRSKTIVLSASFPSSLSTYVESEEDLLRNMR
jgi:hypothetical protein